ncbi:MAG: outer membrane lipoprotein-sorting protein [Deltaproteobacteria bacterium]|nr:outer membrane lipoprotein-sorting protein [Deltaproteobacteria bacterium]
MLALFIATLAWAAPSSDELVGMLKVVDDRQQNNGDWRSLVYIEQKEKDKSDLAYQAAIYRRDADDKLVILFLKPQAEAGKGYLRADSNLFMFDPTVGKWERRTERERIGGTGSQRQDFDQSRLADEYAPTFVAEEKLGQYTVNRIKLAVKAGIDVAYPVVELWLDKATGNVLKRQDFAESGRLMRTTYYPAWNKLYSESKKAEVYFPKEVWIYDEVEKGNQTKVVIQEVDLKPLDPNIFTKAWLESKSR